MSSTRRHDIAKQLVRMLDAAVSADRSPRNPIRDRAGKLPDLPTAEREKPHRYLTAREVHQLASAARQMDEKLRREPQSEAALVLVLAYGGPRFGEVSALTVADLNGDAGKRPERADPEVRCGARPGDARRPR